MVALALLRSAYLQSQSIKALVTIYHLGVDIAAVDAIGYSTVEPRSLINDTFRRRTLPFFNENTSARVSFCGRTTGWRVVLRQWQRYARSGVP